MFGRELALEALATAKQALNRCAEAMSRIEKHEAVCAETKKVIDEIKKGQDRLFWWLLSLVATVAGSAIVAAIGMLMHSLARAGVL